MRADCDDLGWLTGLLEGEGTFNLQPGRAPYPQVRLAMCDKDVVESAARAFPASGDVRRRPPQKEGWTPIWWVVWTGRTAIDLMWAVLPRMGERRSARILDILAECYDARFLPCATCGAGFFLPWESPRNEVVYCSDSCRSERQAIQHREAKKRFRERRGS